ncbi:hypothetical protein NESM_000634400 [Novymonas esmeraldas]|uniref:Uncharacterized protein n=1 Tax=Novymonas esmeraldas TaxID=1808958 RepID=A0AAW0EVY3_9TRYP
MSNETLAGGWLADADGLVCTAAPASASPATPRLTHAASQLPIDGAAAAEDPTPYVLTAQQLDALSATAYLVGSPLQRQQPVGSEVTDPALLVAATLLQHGVDPERIIELIKSRHDNSV